MDRPQTINALSDGRYSSYLEIGVEQGVTFNQVAIPNKVAVDPAFKVPVSQLKGRAFPKTSDDFFKSNHERFDCVFIDGLHIYEQSRQDFINSWDILNAGGLVLIDDCMPSDDLAAMRDHETCIRRKIERGDPDRNWMGDVYKTVIWLNDCTNHAFAYIAGTMGVVAVWQDTIKDREKWIGDEGRIAACAFETFKRFPVPILSVDEISGRLGIKEKPSQKIGRGFKLFWLGRGTQG